MHVLVIGGTRFVGLQLVWRLLAAGHDVTVLNRGRQRDPFGDRVKRLVADRTSPDFARALAGRSFEAAVDFAAYTGADIAGSIDALGRRVGQYVFISTGQVYLVRQGCPFPARETDYDGPLLEEPSDEANRSEWLYGMNKRAAEDLLVRAREESRFPSTRLRIPIVNGPRDPSGRLEGYLWRILDGGPILLPDGGTAPIRHVYSVDVARAIARVLGDVSTLGQVYNFSQRETVSVAELVAELAALLGAPARLEPVATATIEAAGLRPTDISPFSGRWASRLDPGRAKRELGFRATPLHQYLESIVAWFLADHPADPPPSYRTRAAELALVS